MIVEVMGKLYQIGFSHDPAVVMSRQTECYIMELSEENGVRNRRIICSAAAVCHPADQFNRDRGRKISLTRALSSMYPRSGENASLNKELRRKFWAAYLNRNTRNNQK